MSRSRRCCEPRPRRRRFGVAGCTRLPTIPATAATTRATDPILPTIKYYLREGLLEPGTPTGPNQADYRDDHVHRLRLIRALMDVGGLGVGAVRAVLDAIADAELSLHDLLGVAHQALGPPPDREPVPHDVVWARAEVDALLEDLAGRSTGAILLAEPWPTRWWRCGAWAGQSGPGLRALRRGCRPPRCPRAADDPVGVGGRGGGRSRGRHRRLRGRPRRSQAAGPGAALGGEVRCSG